MRRLVALAIIAVVGLAACGGTSTPTIAPTPTISLAPTQTIAALQAQVAALQATINAPTATSAATATPVATPTLVATATATRPAPTNTPLRPTATATPGRAEVKVEQVINVRSSFGSLYYYGVVVNSGQADAGDIQVAISLLGDTGQTLATGSAGSFSMGLPYLKPGERTYFRALIDKAPETWKEERIQVQAGPVSSFTRNLYFFNLKSDGVTCAPPPRASSWVTCTGQAANTGTSPTKSVEITIAAFNAEGKLLAVNSSYAKLDQIAPGDSAPFSIDFLDLKEVPAKIEVQVQGQKVT